MANRIEPFPRPAISWLTGRDQRVLLVGATRGVPRMLAMQGHDVTVIDTSLVALRRACPQPHPQLTPIMARPDAMPFAPWSFDTVLFCQNLHETRPVPTLGEIARVLAPQGHVAVVYTLRDDTVPWVRRLAASVQSVDPGAMRGEYGADSVERLDTSHYFPTVERRTFRTWFPMTREGLLGMVAGRPLVQDASPQVRRGLLREVGEIYDAMSRPPEPLMLPYEARCVRARVAHEELTVPITFEEGLRIL